MRDIWAMFLHLPFPRKTTLTHIYCHVILYLVAGCFPPRFEQKETVSHSPVVITVAQKRHNKRVFKQRILASTKPIHAGKPLTGRPTNQQLNIALPRQLLAPTIIVHHRPQQFITILNKYSAIRIIDAKSLRCSRFFFNL